MSVNVTKLDQELKASGVPIDGVSTNSDGSARVDFSASATAAHMATAAAIVAAHDPSPTREQKLRALGIDPRLAAFVLVMKQGAAAPQWAQDLVAQAVQQLAGIS